MHCPRDPSSHPCVQQEDTTAVLHDTSLSSCSAKFDGGGAFVESSQLSILASAVSDCTADQGAGVFVDSFSQLLVQHSVLTRNSAGFLGGAVFVNRLSSLAVTSSLISFNAATSDGAGLFVTDSSGNVVKTSLLQGNVAAARGGAAVLQQRSSASFYGSMFVENVARLGGGVYLSSESTVAAASVGFRNNRARRACGALLLDGASGSITTSISLSDAFLEGNSAEHSAGT